MKKTILTSAVIILTACASTKTTPPTQADITRIQDKFPNYSLTELNNGKLLYEQHCNNCHLLKKPTSRTEEQWKKIVPEMTAKVNKKTVLLDEKKQESVLKYLITMSSRPK